MDTALVINCYERTWEHVLTPNFFFSIEDQNCIKFTERVLIINNVRNRDVVAQAAQNAVVRREIHRFIFVSDLLTAAMRIARLNPHDLREHPYFLNYGLVMPLCTGCEWIVGWDAEVELEQAHNWITPSILFIEQNANVFSANPNWPERGIVGGSVMQETFEFRDEFALNWGFSDQLFLVRRKSLLGVNFNSFAPAAYCRGGNKEHPGSFEARIEAHQRRAKLYRATYLNCRHTHNDQIGSVMDRIGRTLSGQFRYKLLTIVEKALTKRHFSDPRFRLP